MVKLQYALFIGLKSLEILRVQVLNKSAGRHFSTKLIKVQVLNKSMQVGIFQKINKICCTFIRDTRVYDTILKPSYRVNENLQNSIKSDLLNYLVQG